MRPNTMFVAVIAVVVIVLAGAYDAIALWATSRRRHA